MKTEQSMKQIKIYYCHIFNHLVSSYHTAQSMRYGDRVNIPTINITYNMEFLHVSCTTQVTLYFQDYKNIVVI